MAEGADSDPVMAAVERFRRDMADETDAREEPAHLAGLGRRIRALLALSADTLDACGLEAQAMSLRRCPVKLPGTPLCTLRALNACDTTIRLQWGAEGMLASSTRVFCLESVLLAQAAVFAVMPGVTGDLEAWLVRLELRAQEIRFVVRAMTGR